MREWERLKGGFELRNTIRKEEKQTKTTHDIEFCCKGTGKKEVGEKKRLLRILKRSNNIYIRKIGRNNVLRI